MSLGARLRAGIVSAAGVLILVAGCTSSTADGPTTTAFATMSVTPSVIDPSSLHPSNSAPPASAVESSTLASLDAGAQEAADRAAIEAQWRELWTIYSDLARIPPDDRLAKVSEVTVSPLTENLIEAASQANAGGIDNFGSVTHRIYWQTPVNAQSYATIADCQDQSEAGTIQVSTGETLTEGRPRISLRGDFVKGDDGIWRARQIIDLGTSDC